MGPVKLPFPESDLAPLVKRYTSSTIVTMLREVAKCKAARLDWAMLCKGTATGITNPREYQALWRSIAYRADLDDSFDGNDSPLEDDSDMEVDLDPLPSVSPAVAESICNYVKSDLQQHELEEARLEQNAVQAGMGHQAADVSTARLQPCSAAHGESTASLAGMKVPCSAAMNQSDSRKRRRLWTPEEDLALIAAVDKCGEGNWTAVLKNHYDFDRSASQLSQRWALIRKRREVQEKAGYGIGSGVSPLASGYKDLRPEGLKSAALTAAGSQPGAPKEVAKLGTVPMSIKQPVSFTSSVPVSKRIPVASAPMGTETTSASASYASVLETQRMRALPAPGVSSSWAGAPGLRPQAHGQQQTPMRGSVSAAAAAAGASGAAAGQQVHKGGVPEGSHAHLSGVRRPQVFYTSSQSATSTIPIDSKYAASRNMGAGVAPRGGGSLKGGHGPDPMIQAAAMAAGARIAPASAAASLLKAAQSGNVVHIGSGGLARSKLGLTSQAGSGNAGCNPGIVHYIRTGSGGASLAATSSSLQRTSSHHLAKNQPNNRSFGSNNSGSHISAGNSSPLSVPTVSPAAAQASRNNNNNNPQGPVQSSKPASFSKRGCSPQQRSTSAPPTPMSTLVTTSPIPSSSTTAPSPPAPSSSTTSTPAHGSVPTPAPKSAVTPGLTTSTSTPLSASRLIPSPAPPSTARSIPASTSISAPPSGALASGSVSTPSATSSVPAPPASASRSTLPAASSAPTPASSAFKTALPATASLSTPASSASRSALPAASSAPAHASSAFKTALPATASAPSPASSTSRSTLPAAASAPTPASSAFRSTLPAAASVPTPASSTFKTALPATASAPTPASLTSKPIPASSTSSLPFPASIGKSTPASSTSVSAPASVSRPTSGSTTKPIPGSTPASTTKHVPATTLLAPASISGSTPALTSVSTPASSTSVSAAAAPIPACGFNTAEQGVDSLGDG